MDSGGCGCTSSQVDTDLKKKKKFILFIFVLSEKENPQFDRGLYTSVRAAHVSY